MESEKEKTYIIGPEFLFLSSSFVYFLFSSYIILVSRVPSVHSLRAHSRLRARAVMSPGAHMLRPGPRPGITSLVSYSPVGTHTHTHVNSVISTRKSHILDIEALY